MPLVAIHIPNTGALSRKERDELKAYRPGARPARVTTTPSVWSATIPEQMAKVRERTGAGGERPADAGRLGRRAEGHRPEETVYQACGQLRLFAAQKFNDRHKLLDPKNFQFLWVVDFPMFEWDEEDEPLERRAPSVHVGA